MKKYIVGFALILLTLGLARGWNIYQNPEGIIHPLLIPPDYFFHVDLDDLYGKTGIVAIAGREFEIPIAYVSGHFKKGRKEDSVVLQYVLPDFKSKLEFRKKEDRQALLESGYYGGMLIEESAIRPTFDVMIANRRRYIPKEEASGIFDELEAFKVYQSRGEKVIYYYDLYLEKDKEGKIISFLQCFTGEEFANTSLKPNPGCSHMFRDKKLLYKIRYNKKNYLHDWRNQRKATIEFIDSFEINSTQESEGETP